MGCAILSIILCLAQFSYLFGKDHDHLALNLSLNWFCVVLNQPYIFNYGSHFGMKG